MRNRRGQSAHVASLAGVTRTSFFGMAPKSNPSCSGTAHTVPSGADKIANPAAHAPPTSTSTPVARSTSASSTSGSVVSAPIRTVLLVPW